MAHRQAPTPPPPEQPQHQQQLAGELQGDSEGDEGPPGDAGLEAAGAEGSSIPADTSTAGGIFGDNSGNSSGSNGGPVDIKQLSWEDRERILRLLFAKINRAAQVRRLPGGLGMGQAVKAAQAGGDSHVIAMFSSAATPFSVAAPTRAAGCGAGTCSFGSSGGGSRTAANPAVGDGDRGRPGWPGIVLALPASTPAMLLGYCMRCCKTFQK